MGNHKSNSEFATHLQMSGLGGFLGYAMPEEKQDWKYQLTPVEFSDTDRKRLNIHERNVYYHITCNGKTAVDGIFRQGAFSSSVREMNTKRFIRLLIYRENRYSDEIVKECGLSSPYFLDGTECVVDMEKLEVVLVCEGQSLSSYMHICGNVAVTDTTVGTGVYSLTERKWLLEDKELKTVAEIGDCLFVTKGGYNPTGMWRVNKVTSEVADCCLI